MKYILSLLIVIWNPPFLWVSAFPPAAPVVVTPHGSHHIYKNSLNVVTTSHRNIKVAKSKTCLTAAPLSNLLIATLRGGAEAAINTSREGFYLQALGTYGTVTALVMNAALRLYSSTKFPLSDKKQSTSIFHSTFLAVTALCIVSGAFTAVLFNILGIYSKEALGMLNDVGYKAFKVSTANFTKWGFRAFLTALGSFVVSFQLSLYAKVISEEDDNKTGKVILWASIGLMLLGSFRIKQVIDLGSQFIFC